jgi:NO-binding membrane sensor protein with MHYT domain
MPAVHQFLYGPLTPAVAYSFALVGFLAGLVGTGRAHRAGTRSRRVRWLVIGSVSVAGGAWLMQFTALLGLDVSGSPIRYDVRTILAGAGTGLAGVVAGILIAAGGHAAGAPRLIPRLPIGGLLAGLGLVGSEFLDTSAIRVAGHLGYRPGYAVISAALGLAAAVPVLIFAVLPRRRRRSMITAAVLGAAGLTAMHYLGLAGLRLVPAAPGSGPVRGSDPILLIVPVMVATTTGVIALVFFGLQAMTEEEADRFDELVEAGAPEPDTLDTLRQLAGGTAGGGVSGGALSGGGATTGGATTGGAMSRTATGGAGGRGSGARPGPGTGGGPAGWAPLVRALPPGTITPGPAVTAAGRGLGSTPRPDLLPQPEPDNRPGPAPAPDWLYRSWPAR